MYVWKIVLLNGKEYLVESTIQDSLQMSRFIFGEHPGDVSVSHCKLFKDDKNGCNSVFFINTAVASVEFNFKKEVTNNEF